MRPNRNTGDRSDEALEKSEETGRGLGRKDALPGSRWNLGESATKNKSGGETVKLVEGRGESPKKLGELTTQRRGKTGEDVQM